jgi:protein-disulfide isomerase
VRRIVQLSTGALLAILTIFLAASAGAQSAKKSSAPAPAAAPAAPAEPVKTAGSRTAPITMEVWSDFQCPACRQLYIESIRPLMNDYVRTGKVFFVHRDMPLAMHAHARDAARWANAAAQIDKFEKVAEALYFHQDTWAVDGSRLEAVVASVLSPAEMNRVRQNWKTALVDEAINKDISRGQQFRVNSTPTVVLTHRGRSMPLPGGVNYPLLRRVLDQMLAQ